MESLRWVLLLIGALLVAGIYGWTRLERRSRRAPRTEHTTPPLDASRTPDEPLPTRRPPDSQKIIVLHVQAAPRQTFRGPEIDAAARACGLIHGYMRAYNRHPDNRADKPPLFSLVDMVEPGTFDAEQLESTETTGLTLFLTLPGPTAGPVAFNDMLETARSLAEALNGELQDETHSSLSIQRVENIREELKEFERLQQLGRSN